MPIPVEHAGTDVRRVAALGLRQRADIVRGRAGQIDRALGIARSDRQFVHVNIGRVQQAAFLADGQNGERIRAGLGRDAGAFQRVERDVDLRRATDEVGGPLLVEKSSRGAAFGDYDNDGDIDVLISALDDRPTLLRNDTTGGHWLTIRLEGTTSNRSAIGAKVIIEAAGGKQIAEVRSGGSYISHNDSRVHFGLGDAQVVDVVSIRWPTGKVQTVRSLAADRFYVAREGTGIRSGR